MGEHSKAIVMLAPQNQIEHIHSTIIAIKTTFHINENNIIHLHVRAYHHCLCCFSHFFFFCFSNFIETEKKNFRSSTPCYAFRRHSGWVMCAQTSEQTTEHTTDETIIFHTFVILIEQIFTSR